MDTLDQHFGEIQGAKGKPNVCLCSLGQCESNNICMLNRYCGPLSLSIQMTLIFL